MRSTTPNHHKNARLRSLWYPQISKNHDFEQIFYEELESKCHPKGINTPLKKSILYKNRTKKDAKKRQIEKKFIEIGIIKLTPDNKSIQWIENWKLLTGLSTDLSTKTSTDTSVMYIISLVFLCCFWFSIKFLAIETL